MAIHWIERCGRGHYHTRGPWTGYVGPLDAILVLIRCFSISRRCSIPGMVQETRP
jgi:hypothetical protein